MNLQTKYFIFIAIITLLFCLSIGFDITPLLRGPAPYPPEWQWDYLFVNTMDKLYLPLIVTGLLLGLFWSHETKNIFKKNQPLLIVLLIILSFLFQFSVLYFSRSGIPVLIHRIINPELNSYFTASLQISDPIYFLKNYETEMQQFIYHARSHPPGAILIFYGIKQLIQPFTSFINFATTISPNHTDVKQIWNLLLPIEKATAIFSAFFLPFLSTLTIVPIFKTAKKLYGEKIAIRSSFLFIFLPSIVLFIPINDIFLPLFSAGAFYFLVKGLQDKHTFSFLISGLILFIGTTFNLALLPLLLLFFLFALFFIQKNKLKLINYFKHGSFFALGFFLPPLLLYFFVDFNFLRLIDIILQEVPHIHTRSYTTWLFYNVYDFLIFVGIPLAIVFLTQSKQLFALRSKLFAKIDILFLAFLIMFLIVDLTGSTRGETGRIWSIFMPFLLLPAVVYLTNNKKFSTNLFIGILLLQTLQILVLQEFWVMLW
ncbi:MAG TPA: glycosyltransferase family 39 protein [Patescibacteria group bacterium]|nr:glycosyltransferase family 39 protein [Patescibacteria group bacterium]